MGETHATRHQQAELRLHEARQLAYEYAKQIVLKAYELSQQQQARVSSSASSRQNHINNHERATGQRIARSSGGESPQIGPAAGQCQLDEPIRRRLFEEAAEQINGRFRLSSLDPATKQERRPSAGRHGASNPASDPSDRWRRPSLTQVGATDTSHGAKSSIGADLDHDSHQRQASVYIEQDYATISSDDQQQQRQTTAGTTNGHRNQRRSNNNQGGRRGRSFQQCLNWHLIVSCFSTCLPEPFGNRHASATSKMSPSGGPTRV